MIWLIPVILILFAFGVRGQEAKEGTPGDAQKTVTIRRILVEGTRLPPLSVIRLAQIKAGDEVNFLKLHAAMGKVSKTGLIKGIDFEYESMPDKDTDIIVHLKCVDEAPTAKASIQIPNVNQEDVWAWLTQLDPLFTREMPANDASIAFYSRFIGKYMQTHGDPQFDEHSAVIGQASTPSGAKDPDAVIFKVVKRR